MFASLVVISAALLGILTTTVLHLPFWLQRSIAWIPAWLQAALIHFVYGGWIGGVTGHLVGGLVSVPWFFIARYWIRPRVERQVALHSERTSPSWWASRHAHREQGAASR